MALVIKSEAKFKSVIESLPVGYSESQFVEKFKEMYEKDCKKV